MVNEWLANIIIFIIIQVITFVFYTAEFKINKIIDNRLTAGFGIHDDDK